LVTAGLERQWNAKLEHVEAVKRRTAAVQTEIRPLSVEQKQSLLRLADDLPSVWRADSTTVEMRKRIIRTVLEEAVVDVERSRAKIILDLHWERGCPHASGSPEKPHRATPLLHRSTDS
jgi:hypothetical protein